MVQYPYTKRSSVRSFGLVAQSRHRDRLLGSHAGSRSRKLPKSSTNALLLYSLRPADNAVIHGQVTTPNSCQLQL